MKETMKDVLSGSNTSIEILKQWDAMDEEFYTPGVLIRVRQGKGSLREVFGETKEGKTTFLTYMLDDKPLLQLQGEEYFCPTCEKIIRSGYGLEQTFHLDMANINKDKEVVALEEAVKYISPILGLLPSGFYVILDTCLHPTDGNGNLFWDKLKDTPSDGIRQYYHGNCQWGKLRPYFTVATQPREKCNKERVEYYRQHSNGRAIAYYIDGYITALIDGHHKTLAAAMDHRDVNSLVIMSGHCVFHSEPYEDRYRTSYRIGDMNFTMEDLDISEDELRELDGNNMLEYVSPENLEKICNGLYTESLKAKLPIDTKGLADWYPMAEEQAKIERGKILLSKGAE